MADVFIAAAAEANANASGLADALRALGFTVEDKLPAEAELSKAVADAKCVLAVFPAGAPTPPWLAAVAALAHERKTLVCLELDRDAAPVLFRSAPRFELRERDRAAFKARFETLVAAIDKLAPREGRPTAEKASEALVQARAALTARDPSPSRTRTLGMVALVVGLVFAVGFGAGRILNAVRSGALLVAPVSDNAEAALAEGGERSRFGVTLDELETLSWRDAAAKIDEADADRIKAEANRGDALAQTLACLGHMAGAQGFLPSPAAARQACDAAAGQGYPAALYLSWALRRAAPYAAVDEATARARLRASAEQGWLAGQLDYAQLLAGDFRTPIADQTAAGRLWLAVAERGDPRGQFQYARWLRDSPAGPRDPAAALPFLERAAESNQPEAMHMLATLLRDGVGAPRDLERARALYERAAGRNYPPSMFNLAAMIEAGPGADRARAASLYRTLACMPDERQIQPMAVQRLRAMGETPAACG